MSADSEDDVDLVQRSLLALFLEEYLYPILYRPFDILDEFLRENTHIFTLIGVFGAVTIYLRNFAEQSGETVQIPTNWVAVVGFFIVLLLSALVLVKLAKISGRIDWWYDSLGLWAFAIPFFAFISIILGAISQFAKIWAIIYLVAILDASVVIPFIIIGGLLIIADQVEERFGKGYSVLALGLFAMFIIPALLIGIYPDLLINTDNILAENGISVLQLGHLFFSLSISLIVFGSLLALGVLIVLLVLNKVRSLLSFIDTKFRE